MRPRSIYLLMLSAAQAEGQWRTLSGEPRPSVSLGG